MKVTLELVRLRRLLTLFAAIALSVGCGEGKLQSLTGPSGTPGSTTFLTGDASDGTATASSTGAFDTLGKGGNGGGKEKDKDKSKDDDPSGTPDDDAGKKPGDDDGGPGRSHEARVVGFVSAKAGDTLTVNGVAVVAGRDAVIRHGNRTLTMADIEVGDHIQARGAMEGTTLVATEIKVEDTGRDNDDVNEAEIEGTISGLSATTSCPVVTFTIGTTKVTTSAATVFDDVTCATLANNALVEVEGIRQPDGSILAKKVEAEAGPDEVEGTVFEFSGAASCPTGTFKVGPTLSLATAVTTTATTTFSGVTCATLANGARVGVEGTKQANGSITAASVELK
jgi:hypothetical protein